MARTGPYSSTWEQYIKDLDQEFWDGEDQGLEKAIIRLEDELELEVEKAVVSEDFLSGLKHAIETLRKASTYRQTSKRSKN